MARRTIRVDFEVEIGDELAACPLQAIADMRTFLQERVCFADPDHAHLNLGRGMARIVALRSLTLLPIKKMGTRHRVP